jgi:hypothetical protein
MALFGMKNDSLMVLLMVVAGGLVLWYLLGRETCEGCYHECNIEMHGDPDAAGKCARQCLAKGLTCSAAIQKDALMPVVTKDMGVVPYVPLYPRHQHESGSYDHQHQYGPSHPPPMAPPHHPGLNLGSFEGDSGMQMAYAPQSAHQYGS